MHTRVIIQPASSGDLPAVVALLREVLQDLSPHSQEQSGLRAWLDTVFGQLGWVDAFRTLEQEPEQYTWWSNRGRAWDNNVGWRIDYQVVTPGLADKVLRTEIYTEQRFSDHAPLTMDYDWTHGG